MMRIVARFKHFTRGLAAAGGNRYDREQAAVQLQQQAAFWRSVGWRTACVSWDATRFAGRETLWMACSTAEEPRACWAAPVVPAGAWGK
eukprot:15447185-Alexandrium_andersonii.AAC.1